MQEAGQQQGLNSVFLEAEPELVVPGCGTVASSTTAKLHDSFKKCLDYGLSTPSLQVGHVLVMPVPLQPAR
jgi:hypothetical protein